MGNALLSTGLLLGAAVLGGFVGSCCAKGRRTGDCEARVAELEDRLDALATHCMDEGKRLKDRMGSNEDMAQRRWEWIGGVEARVSELEFLVGDTPTGGLLGRVGALEEAARKGAQDD